MDKVGSDIDERSRPLSPWAYVGYGLLFCIPLIGLIFLIIFSLSDKSISRRNFARAFLLVVAIVLLLFLFLLFSGGLGLIAGLLFYGE